MRDGVKQVMDSMNISSDAYQLGKTKIFIKNPTTVFALEEYRDERLEDIVKVCVCVCVCWMCECVCVCVCVCWMCVLHVLCAYSRNM
jgi:hypothetical protein